jgi:hypothetical protein
MEAFELMSPAVHFYVYFVFGIVATLVLKFIFKKSATYYIIFLSTIFLFSFFSKDLFTNLPYNVMDIPHLVAKVTGVLTGLFAINLFLKQRKNKTRRLS